MSSLSIATRSVARLHRAVPAMGWGAFKIGRDQGAKYPNAFQIPSEAHSIDLVHELIRAGVRFIDTAPAYGLSEERLGKAFATLPAALRQELFITTKVGEQFIDGASQFDFSAVAVTRSVQNSLRLMGCNYVDGVFVHSNGFDEDILAGDCVSALHQLKSQSLIGFVGFSSKTLEGGRSALRNPLVDAVMLEIHPNALDMLPLLPLAAEFGKAVFIKKPLASGTLKPMTALPWILAQQNITSIVLGGLNATRLRENFSLALQA